LRARFLHESHQRRQRDHRQDHHRRVQVVGQPGHRGECAEQQVEGVAVAVPQVHRPGDALLARDLVGAARAPDRRGLDGAQALRVAVQPLQQRRGFGPGCREQPRRQVARHRLAPMAAAQHLGHRRTLEQPAQGLAAPMGRDVQRG
jgi:hypothetical protein